jgi:hypothetical protein
MKTAVKKSSLKKRPTPLCTLAATILGHLRTVEVVGFSARQLTDAFPAFNSLELAHAIDELIGKQLLIQKGQNHLATFTLTDEGREVRVVLA